MVFIDWIFVEDKGHSYIRIEVTIFLVEGGSIRNRNIQESRSPFSKCYKFHMCHQGFIVNISGKEVEREQQMSNNYRSKGQKMELPKIQHPANLEQNRLCSIDDKVQMERFSVSLQ